MRCIFILVFISIFSILGAQNQYLTFDGDARSIEDTEPYRQVFDEGINGFYVQYNFPGASVNSIFKDNKVFQNLYIKNFSHTQNVGMPSLPSHIDIIIVPEGAMPIIQLIEVDTTILNNFLIYPALAPASDEFGAPNPEFYFDSVFYASNAIYPSSPVLLREIVEYKGVKLALIEVFPVQYNPASRKIYAHSKIKYKVNFTFSQSFINPHNLSANAMKILPNLVLNNAVLLQEIDGYLLNYSVSQDPDYIIVTHPDYLAAADSLANWKRKLGFKPEIISSSVWTSSDIRNQIANKYFNYSPSPDYLVFLGDNDKVPGQILNNGTSNFASDLYYSTMDGSGDFVPDMAVGRISVNSSAQAIAVVNKIINYEKNPILDSGFYSSGLNCAYFQHAGNGYAERRFAQTSEEIRNHVINQGYNVDRVYYTESTVNPQYWNNGLYSAGESIPSYLQKPSFPWNGNANNINAAINAGKFYVFHRDHGMSSGWGDPYYTTSHLNSLNNGSKLPVVFSINCLTGKYMDAESFAERFLRIPNGGAVGVFAHGEVSYSGYNDGLALGLIDAMWSNPGLIPTFSGSGGVQNPILTNHNDIRRMGDVKNQGLIRMIESWGGTSSSIKYTHELFNYFGDPAMEIRTSFPQPILASTQDTIYCYSDSVLAINYVNFDGLATLVIDNELISSAQIVNGSANLYFSNLSGTSAVLTISGYNLIPFSKTIIIHGGCPRADFSIHSNKYCVEDSFVVVNNSSGSIMSMDWDFGSGAFPPMGIGNGPFSIVYNTPGFKDVVLTILDSANNQIILTKTFWVDSLCRYTLPSTGNLIIQQCEGLLLDDGGSGNYSDNSLSSFTISPVGASQVILNFQSFNYESGSDFIKIYDGSSVNSPLIGVYTGSVLPNSGQIISSSGSITIAQETDSYSNFDGFALHWHCVNSNSSPVCDFHSSDSLSCDGHVRFFDNSTNGPTNWLWDFGDGNSSSDQNPNHFYNSNGVFNVKLKVANSHGVDSIIKNSSIKVNRPTIFQFYDTLRCKSGMLNLSTDYQGFGTVWWFDSIHSEFPLDTGKFFKTPVLLQSRNYFAEIHEAPNPQFIGKKDSLGNGAYFSSNTAHYLVFDSYKPFLLKSVEVYSSTAGNRTIQLLNSGGSLLISKVVFIPIGKSRVILDFEVPQGINLRLAGPPSPNLYRNSGGINYPYSIDNVLNIKYSSATSNPTGYYYYFYDWEIVEGECVSLRRKVEALVIDTLNPLADFSFNSLDPFVDFTFTGNYGDSYYWDFGDGDFSLLPNPSHIYKSNGNFNVTCIVTNGCGQKSITKTVNILSANLQTSDEFERLVLYPVPVKNILNIDLFITKNQWVNIKIFDISGRIVEEVNKESIVGENLWNIDLNNLSQGVYILRMDTKSGSIIRQFVKE